jgi:hypothetical protein
MKPFMKYTMKIMCMLSAGCLIIDIAQLFASPHDALKWGSLAGLSLCSAIMTGIAAEAK